MTTAELRTFAADDADVYQLNRECQRLRAELAAALAGCETRDSAMGTLQAEIICLRGELATARAYIDALERAAAAAGGI